MKLAIVEARLEAVEEFKGSSASKDLICEKSKWALMYLAGAILGEFKERNPHVNF